MATKIQALIREYPTSFWILITGTFIDRVGGALLFPFFSLYITEHFGVGMIEVGIIFSIFALSNVVGGTIGGALADRIGRKTMLVFGLITSGASSLLMGFVNQINLFYVAAVLMGLLSNIGSPAQQAMIADLLPRNQRADGYGVLRVSANLAVTIGPALGGLLAAYSYQWLFISDFVASAITAVIVFLKVPESKPPEDQHKPKESLKKTFMGYFEVFKDGVYIRFLLIFASMVLVYRQMSSTLSVFLRDEYGFSAKQFGYLISLNAGMVVLFQFWITRRIKRQPPMYMMAVGALLYSIGFGLYGFITQPWSFYLAMAVITVGEMISAPFSQSVAAMFAPEDKRGRYMAIRDYSRYLPNIFGILGAGVIMERFNPHYVWYIAGAIGLFVTVNYILIHKPVSARIAATAAKDKEIDIINIENPSLLLDFEVKDGKKGEDWEPLP